MKSVTVNSFRDQQARLAMKTKASQLKNLLIHGTGMSPWEAQVGVDTIEEVIFNDPSIAQAKHGQLRYLCVSAEEGAGKALKECQMKTVLLTILDEADEENCSETLEGRSTEIRRRRLSRIADEAKEQGGYLSQEDLAKILMCDVRTIRRDVKELKGVGIIIPTRGQQKDIGPGISHRSAAVKQWLEGKEPVEICRHIKHSMKAVENYLQKFKRVAFLREKEMDILEIAMTIGISGYATKEFIRLYDEFRGTTFFKQRLEEIALVGGNFGNLKMKKKLWNSQENVRTKSGGSHEKASDRNAGLLCSAGIQMF